MGPLVVLTYVVFGLYLAHRLPPNDMERSMLDLDKAEMANRYAREFGGEIPRRMPFRLPLEYWLWGWAKDLHTARYAALGVGLIGIVITIHWGGIIAGLIVLSSPLLVGALTSASYVPYVATLWVGGLYALSTGNLAIAGACGLALACLRPTSWWQAAWLLWASGWILLASGLAAVIWVLWPEVVRSQGWWRLLRGEGCPVQAIPQEECGMHGWHYAGRVAGRRYESWGAWALVAIALGHWSPQAAWLLGLTGALFTLTHLPRMLIRPKWAVGYMAEWMLPVAVAVALAVSIG